jgi:WD40 repeat protein
MHILEGHKNVVRAGNSSRFKLTAESNGQQADVAAHIPTSNLLQAVAGAAELVWCAVRCEQLCWALSQPQTALSLLPPCCDATTATQVYAIAFNNPFGDKVVTGSFDKTARVWDAYTGQCLHILKGDAWC